jgi:hypothetical protein
MRNILKQKMCRKPRLTKPTRNIFIIDFYKGNCNLKVNLRIDRSKTITYDHREHVMKFGCRVIMSDLELRTGCIECKVDDVKG